MPIVLLIRHGENDYIKKGRLAGRLPGVHLNQNGRQQAQALAERLAGAPIKAIYSSPLERTIETAQPLAQTLGLEIIPRPGLIEVDFGEWQNQKLKGLGRTKQWKVVQWTPSRMRFPGGETFAEAQFRICRELDDLASMHEAEDIFACVTHSDPIRLAVAFYLGMPLDFFQRLSVSPASITALMMNETGNRLLTLNYDLSFTLPKS
jgi:probable phosphoglycerate mutase